MPILPIDFPGAVQLLASGLLVGVVVAIVAALTRVRG